MRVNQETKSVDMEARDINYILPAYVRSYLFYSKNEMPEKIIFPMFLSVSVQGKEIPIEYVPPLDPVAIEIAKDGSNVAEVTSAQEAVLDEKDEEIKRLKADLAKTQAELEGTAGRYVEDLRAIPNEEATIADKPEPIVSAAKAAFAIDPDPTHQPPAGRAPKLPPGGDIGPGIGPSDMQPRDRRDLARMKQDLAEGPDIDDEAEKPFEKEIKRDKQGKPVVEDKPNATGG